MIFSNWRFRLERIIDLLPLSGHYRL